MIIYYNNSCNWLKKYSAAVKKIIGLLMVEIFSFAIAIQIKRLKKVAKKQ